MPRFTALTASLLLVACSTAPADPPPAGAGGAWIEPQAPGGVSDTWWTLFGDPQLVSLIDQAVAGSPDLRAADARLAEARAVRDVVHGAEGPQVTTGPVSGVDGVEVSVIFDFGVGAIDWRGAWFNPGT